MKNSDNFIIDQLISKGVTILKPESVFIDKQVDISRISDKNVTIYPGTRIFGENTLICSHAKIGFEGPVTIENCYIGHDVKLKGGFFSESVFLKGVEMGSGSHVRSGTILEEYASAAHCTGLKQTILFPFVTLGSLINFCDCFMAGGTSRKDHSEVGSSFIHFNYTPNQDKATASLIGDVPSGVMLNNRPIFLGGQGAIAGPCSIAYGTVSAAGSIIRKNQIKENHLVFDGIKRSINMKYTHGIYQNVKGQVINNIIYLANIITLLQWYKNIRKKFIYDSFSDELYKGLIITINMAIDERIKRFADLCDKIENSVSVFKKSDKNNSLPLWLTQQIQLYKNKEELINCFNKCKSIDSNSQLCDIFVKNIDKEILESGKDYIKVIKNLEKKDAKTGTQWLCQIKDNIIGKILNIIPLFLHETLSNRP